MTCFCFTTSFVPQNVFGIATMDALVFDFKDQAADLKGGAGNMLAMCDGCCEAMEKQSLFNRLETENYFQNEQVTHREESKDDQISSSGSPLQVAATQLHLTSGLGYGCTHIPSQPAS